MDSVRRGEDSPARRWCIPTALLILLASQALWSGWFIYRTSFPIDGERHFSLFDDAMISMTYARNVTEGHGLRWSRHGEPVEGFTTPLWTAVMVPAQVPSLPLRLRPLIIQSLSLALLLLNTILIWRLVRRFFRVGEQGTALPAVVLSALYYPLAYWSLMGMETALQAVLCTAAVFLAFRIVEDGANRGWALGGVLALAYLTRMDMLILVVVVLGWIALRGGYRREELRSWLIGGMFLVGAILGYQVFRQLYFGDPLPNTYYLKLTGIPLEERLLRGLAALIEFVRASFWPVALLLVGILATLRRNSRYLLPAALLGAYASYVVWIGGDAWEMDLNVRANRFLAFVLPQAFVILNGLLNQILSRLRSPMARRYVATATTLFLWLTWNGLWLSKQEEANWRAIGVLERPLFVTSHALVLKELRDLQRIAEPEATVATFWAGIPAYFSDFRTVDMLGYTDPYIARLDARIEHGTTNPLKRFTPGHGKWSYEDLLGRRRPDVVFQVWGVPPDRQPELFRPYGYEKVGRFWVRKDANTIRRPPSGG